jgi:osmotically inducible lipoprotein OsmB
VSPAKIRSQRKENAMIRRHFAFGLALAAVFAAGCAANPTKQEIGTVSGAVVGGLAGSAVTGSTLGTAAGAGLGAYVGNRIGKELDSKNK